ncbi:MAG: 50S ribosomal protein L1 [Opitutales bacterium]|nr:50S ribosomal protein L1 [Opitutales bacterium]
MATISKRIKQAREAADLTATYTIDEAVGILNKFPAAKFDETVEISAVLGVDPKQSNQMVRGTVSLPHGSGKKVSVVVFTENAQEALDAGADHAGLEDIIAKIQEGWLDFDVAVATTKAMAKVKPVARVLGPRGLMPNPKSGTVTDDVATAIKAVKAGRVEFKMDKSANVAITVGKRSFEKDALIENLKEALDVLVKAKPEVYKGRFINAVTISSTMSPGVKIALSELSAS